MAALIRFLAVWFCDHCGRQNGDDRQWCYSCQGERT